MPRNSNQPEGVGPSQPLFGLPVTKCSAWIFNCYVIDSGSELTVVDPGLPIVARKALTHIERDLDRKATDIEAVICTHGHPDHVGGVSTIIGDHPTAVHLPHLCKDYLEGERPRNFPLVESSVRFLPVWAGQPFDRKAFTEFAKLGKTIGFGGPPDLTLDFEPSGFLADGAPMAGAPGWKVIHTPGHTDDSTSFYHADSETLISGDAVVTLDGRAWFNPEYVDAGVAAVTEEKLRSLSVRHLLPGHGEPIQAGDVWTTARSFSEPPTSGGVLARCSRRLGRWGN